MWLYIIIFAIPLLAYSNGGAVNRNKRFLGLYLLALALFVGFADMLGGYDRYIYGDIFDSIADGITENDYKSVLFGVSFFEPGFSAISYLIALITENRYIYILIITMMMYYCIYKSFERSMDNYPLAIIIFFGMTFFFTFTYLRQVLAFSVAWWSVRFLIDKKRWKFFVAVVAIALLHKSGIIFAVLYFLPLKKWKPVQVIILMAICAILGLTGVTGTLYDAYTNSVSDLNYTSGYSADGEARIAYFLEVIFFLSIILLNYRKIDSSRRSLIFLNMALMFCGLLLLFIRSSDGGRVAWFFTLGIIYTITQICTTGNMLRKVKNNVGILMIVVMLALYVRVYEAWQHYNNLYPYKTFLTDGHRDPDFSWRYYEYDHQYDKDKFYRPVFRFLK